MQKTQIALFPLQIFLLPGEKTRLHIFEERYRQLIGDCTELNIQFGIPYTKKGYLTGFGCTVRVNKVLAAHPNGSSDIEIEAIDLFKIEQFFLRMGEKLYPGGDVLLMETRDLPSVSEKLMKTLGKYIRNIDPAKFPELLSTNLTVFDVARIVNLGEDDKLKLVKASTQQLRENLLITNLKFLEVVEKQKSSIQGEVFLN